MSIIIDLDKNHEIVKESVMGLGNFDGLHSGHREIIKKVKEISKQKNLKSSVLLFKQHTNEVFPHFPRYYISSLEDKIEILKELDIDYIYIINFTLDFAQLNNEEFILDFLRDKLLAKHLVCGPDYTFGKKSKGNVDTLDIYQKEGLIDVYVQEYIMDRDKKISSTLIRSLIENGKVSEVKKFLCRNYSISGTVIHGFKIGSKELGYPTANIKLNFKYIIPEEGVYLTYAYHQGKKFLSLTSIGTNPTVTDSKDVKLEVFILDFNSSIYGDEIKIEFLEKIRNQIKFDNKDDLIDQMNKDFEYARNFQKENFTL